MHPLVRTKMIKSLKNKKIKFFEIPLLIENKLDKYFNVIITVTAKKSFRVKRFKKREEVKRYSQFWKKGIYK